MEELKALLSQLEGAPESEDKDELEEWLKKEIRQFGNKTSSVLPGSELHTTLTAQREKAESALKLLRRMEREQKEQDKQNAIHNQSGLVPKGTNETPATDDEKIIHIKKLYAIYSGEDGNWNLDDAIKAYKEISNMAEKGDAAALNTLGVIAVEHGYRDKGRRVYTKAAEKKNAASCANMAAEFVYGEKTIKDEKKAREYMDKAAELGGENNRYVLRRATYFETGKPMYGYEKNTEEAFKQYKLYLDKLDELDLSDENHRKAFYKYFAMGNEIERRQGIKVLPDTDVIEEQLSQLWKTTGEYASDAEVLLCNIWLARGNHIKVINYYFKQESVDGIKRVFELYDWIKDSSLKEKLDHKLTSMMEDDKTKKEIRVAIYDWYAWRYYDGQGVIRDKARAFLYYWELEKLGNERGKRNRITILNKARNDSTVIGDKFLSDVGEAGYWDAYKYLGDRYARLGGLESYQKAQKCYLYAQNGDLSSECKTLCKNMTDKVESALIYDNALKMLETEHFEEAFANLKQLAQKEFPDACMKIAEISEERDSYLGMKLRNQLLPPQDIREQYQMAANAGLKRAQQKMVQIYKDGILGAEKNSSMQQKWEYKLNGAV